MFLSLVFHNHQPVGQLPWVFEEAWRSSYDPFLDVLEDHPQIKIALHYTGPLLDWLESHRPETLERVRELASRGQVEVLGGGYYEPILAIWPREDQDAQLAKLNNRILELFDTQPRGLWLAERVWEPSLVTPIRGANLDYTFVDSTVFEAAHIRENDSFGSFAVRQNDELLTVFPINQELRHRIPWHTAQETISYLKKVHEREGDKALAVFADDGEKFGAWPGTFNFVFEEGWLETFFTALTKESSWLRTITPGEWSSTRSVKKEVVLPAGSYSEMQSWSGGNWRNFLQKYRESRDIYEEVLRVRDIVISHPTPFKQPKHEYSSADSDATPDNSPSNASTKVDEAAFDLILQAQSNDALWHGAFGGLYLRHLRQAMYARTAEAQVRVEGTTPFARVQVEPNGDAILENERIKIGIRADNGSIFNWTSKASRHNVLSTLRRLREEYHTPDVPEDWYPRGACIDHFLSEHTSLHGFAQTKFSEQGDFASEEWQLQARCGEDNQSACIALAREGGVWSNGQFQPLLITKAFNLQAESDDVDIEYSICNTGNATLHLWHANEWNIALSGVDVPTRHYHAVDRKVQSPLDEEREWHGVTNPIAGDSWLRLLVEWQFPQEVEMWHAPIWSISQKEGGAIEKSHQSSAFVFHHRLHLAPQTEFAWKFVASLHSQRAL